MTNAMSATVAETEIGHAGAERQKEENNELPTIGRTVWSD